MNSEIRKLLESVQAGKTSVDDAMLELKKAPFALPAVCRENKALLYFDNTMFGKGDEGFLLTESFRHVGYVNDMRRCCVHRLL